MDRKRLLVTSAVLVVFAVLVYLQFRTWRTFDWGLFLNQTDGINKRHILHGVVLIYVAYLLRALRWKIFLRPVRPKASSMQLLSPTLVGFAGLALLGRPGELIRP